MARRTKQDANRTRDALLDAAERVFHLQGVAGTSMKDIAEAAGMTRGAIYWHFNDKADLFNAMMDRVSLPLQEVLAHAQSETGSDSVALLRRAIEVAFTKAVHDPRTRRVFEVATHKVEYVESLCAVRQRHQKVRDHWIQHFRVALLASAAARRVELRVNEAMAAQGLCALIDGLIQNWLLDTGAFDLQAVGRCAVDAYLYGLGLAAPSAQV